MKILGNGKTGSSKTIIVEITEKEADMFTGVHGRPHITGRYKKGQNVNITAIYNKVQGINKKHAEIKAAAQKIKTNADDIDKALPL